MDVLMEASKLGFSLREEQRGDHSVWTWRRGIDFRWPSFLTRGQALSWMQARIERGANFDR